MKKVLILLFLLLFGCQILLADSVIIEQKRTPLVIVKQALLSYEANVLWSAVTGNWRQIRPQWINQLRRTVSIDKIASLLIQLETNIRWSAVHTSWRGIRANWLRTVGAVKSAAGIAKQLLGLERYTRWSAVTQSWRSAREEWITNLKDLLPM